MADNQRRIPSAKNRSPLEISEQRGGEWPMRPNDFLPWKSVSDYFRQRKKCGLWPRIDEKLGQEVGEAGAKQKEAKAGYIRGDD